MSLRLSHLQSLILLAVAKYRFLTNSQLELMGFGKRDTIRKATGYLARTPARMPFLMSHKFPAYARTGRLENVYSISAKGLEIVADLTGGNELSRATSPLYDADFFHRRAMVSFQFLLDKALDQSPDSSVEFFDQYFHKHGANHRRLPGLRLTASTKVCFQRKGFFIPDSIFIVHKGKHRALFAVECVFGNKKTRTLRQIQKHMRALSEGVLTKKYGLPKQDYVALFFFHDPKLRERVMSALTSTRKFMVFHRHFLFADLKEVQGYILTCWYQVGDDRFLYDFVTGKPSRRFS